MEQSLKLITEENSFFAKRTICSIEKYKKCLDKFSGAFEKEITLKTETSIFLDTNVLLRYYSISFTTREKLFKFLNDNKKRLLLSPQTQLEFLRNREDIIQRFFEQVTSKIPKDFNSEIVNRMKGFLDQYKIILKDYLFVESGITKHQNDLEEILKKLNEAVDSKRKEHIDLIVKDKFLDFLSTCNQCDTLTTDELKIIKNHFDTLSKNLSSDNIDSLLNKPNFTFPGIADIKLKPEDPYGDFIIFHEMMKYMMNKNVDIIFLTFDNSKGDWMNKNKSPHLHYVQNIYANTGQIIYIVDAERAFGDLLNIDIDSLVTPDTVYLDQPITKENLYQFAKNSTSFIGVEVVPFPDYLIKELEVNGYNFMFEIERDIEKVFFGLQQFRKKNPHLNSIGVMRTGLRIANPNYILEIKREDPTIRKISDDRIQIYRKYSELKE